MNKMIPIFAFGIGLIVVGFYWALLNDMLNSFFLPYILTDYTAWGVHYTHDKYYDFIEMLFNILPWVLVLIGTILLIASGSGSEAEE